jgi:hypothetical protein
MPQLLYKATFDFSEYRVRDTPLFIVPKTLIVGVEDGSTAEILDAAYLIQYPFLDGFGFVKGEYFKLSASFNLLSFSVAKRSKLRLLPLRKQQQITLSIWDYEMPLNG